MLRTTWAGCACLLVLFAGSSARGQSAQSAQLASRDCAALASATLTDAHVTSATAVAASADGTSVAHCKALGVIGKEIRFQVLLPDNWNGRFFMEGAGGFAGTLEIGGMRYLRLGYAAASTDTGHDASPIQAGWALNNPERLANYGHVAVHRAAQTAKALISAYYSRGVERAYFNGCSNGGRQALMEAQRDPDDFDGIIAGAPAYNITNIAGAFIKNLQAVFPTPETARTPVVTSDNLALIERAALDRCDAADGVRDAVIDSPTKCRFSLDAVKACPGDTAGADCLTRAQRRAIAAIYAPTKAGGKVIYPGQPLGGEHDPEGWRQWITGVDDGLLGATNGQASSLQAAFGPEVLRSLRVLESSVGLHEVRPRPLGAGYGSGRARPRRRQSRLAWTEGAWREVDPLAWVGGPGAECGRDDRLLQPRETAHSWGERLHEAVHDARCPPLQRRIRTGQSRLDHRHRGLGRARQSARPRGQPEEWSGRSANPHASAAVRTRSARSTWDQEAQTTNEALSASRAAIARGSISP